MTIAIDAFVGRANARRYNIMQDDALVAPDRITKVLLHLGGNCLDTSNPADPIELVEGATQIKMQLGLWEHAVEGIQDGHFIVFDALAPEGLAWPEKTRVKVTFYAWPTC